MSVSDLLQWALPHAVQDIEGLIAAYAGCDDEASQEFISGMKAKLAQLKKYMQHRWPPRFTSPWDSCKEVSIDQIRKEFDDLGDDGE